MKPGPKKKAKLKVVMLDEPQLQARAKGVPPHLPPVETRFQNGKSGNPGGKPAGYVNYGQRLRNRAMRIIRSADGEETTEGDAIVAKLHKLAIVDGKIEAARLIMQVADGLRDPGAPQVNFEQVRNVTIQVVGDAAARAATHEFLQRITYDAGRVEAKAALHGGNGNAAAHHQHAGGNGNGYPHPGPQAGGEGLPGDAGEAPAAAGGGAGGPDAGGGGEALPGGPGGPGDGPAVEDVPAPPGDR